MTRTQLLPRIFELSVEDQLMIVEAIRNHVAGGLAPAETEQEFKAELERRRADYYANPSDESTWEEVAARLRAKR